MLDPNSDVPKAISAKLQIGEKQVDALVTIFNGSLEVSLTSDDYFGLDFGDQNIVSGITTDLKYICLMNIVVKQGLGAHTSFVGNRSSWSSVLTAQFLAISDCPFVPSASSILGVDILNEQISQICHNPDTLTTIIESQAAIEKLAAAGLVDLENDKTGWKSEVQVRLDKGNSFEAAIENGSVVGSPVHPNLSFSTARRLIDNRYLVGIEFSEPTDFYDALSKCTALVRLCEFSYGIEILLERLQLTLPDVMRIIHREEHEYPNYVEVYFFDLGFGTRRTSMDAWRFGRLGDWRDALVAPARNKLEFEAVVANWFATELERSQARARLLDGYRNGSSFPSDRLIGACAAFELLPDVSKPVQNLPDNVKELAEGLKQMVENADVDTDWKNRFKQQLGLVKGTRTKDIIQHRLNQIRLSDPDFLPDCELVLIHAVKLRNRLIHGSSTKLAEAENNQFQPFFTSVLEVIFVFSELMDCGYDLKKWRQPMFPQGNPLAVTIWDFDLQIKSLKIALGIEQTS
jgi:hypothetical protein